MSTSHWKIAIVSAAATLLLGASAHAQSYELRGSVRENVYDWLTLEAYSGYLTGQSREFVYDAGTGKKISQLNWNIDAMGVVGGSVAIKATSWLSFQVGGWVPFAARNKMDDYDWLVPTETGWSHWSHHDDTELKHGSMLDARAVVQVASYGPSSLSLLGGYRHLNLSWSAKSGTYVASSGGGFRNNFGTFPEWQQVISYEQWFETPYLGVAATFTRGPWSFNGEVIGSLWASARDRDDHHLRTLLFEERAPKMSMLGASGTLTYQVTPTLAAVGRAEYQEFFEGRGPTEMLDYATGVVTVYPGDSSGIAHRSVLLTIGLKARLQ